VYVVEIRQSGKIWRKGRRDPETVYGERADVHCQDPAIWRDLEKGPAGSIEIQREYPHHQSTKIPTSKILIWPRMSRKHQIPTSKIPIWPRMSRKHQKKPTTPATNKKDPKKLTKRPKITIKRIHKPPASSPSPTTKTSFPGCWRSSRASGWW
jgi:hypothetical protein